MLSRFVSAKSLNICIQVSTLILIPVCFFNYNGNKNTWCFIIAYFSWPVHCQIIALQTKILSLWALLMFCPSNIWWKWRHCAKHSTTTTNLLIMATLKNKMNGSETSKLHLSHIAPIKETGDIQHTNLIYVLSYQLVKTVCLFLIHYTK